MSKKKIGRLLSVVVFVFVFTVIYRHIEEILIPQVGKTKISTFYNEIDRDSLEVLFMGSSHAYYSILPMDLWKEYGVPSYVLGSPNQAVGATYYLLKDSLKYQKPKVVVIEGYLLATPKKVAGQGVLQRTMDGMPMSVNKIQMGEDLLSDELSFEERLPYYIPMMQYHSRWSELSGKDFDEKSADLLKGGKLTVRTKTFDAPPVVTTEQDMPEHAKYYLDKIIELCDSNDIQLVIFTAPFAGTKKGKEGYIERQQIYNNVGSYLEEKAIPFINYASLVEEIGLDFGTDYRDYGHMNLFGAQKVSGHLFKFITDNYSLGDYRGTSEYKIWDENIEKYDKKLKEKYERKERKDGKKNTQ